MRGYQTFIHHLLSNFFLDCLRIFCQFFFWNCINFFNNIKNEFFSYLIFNLICMLDSLSFFNSLLTIKNNTSSCVSYASTKSRATALLALTASFLNNPQKANSLQSIKSFSSLHYTNYCCSYHTENHHFCKNCYKKTEITKSRSFCIKH